MEIRNLKSEILGSKESSVSFAGLGEPDGDRLRPKIMRFAACAVVCLTSVGCIEKARAAEQPRTEPLSADLPLPEWREVRPPVIGPDALSVRSKDLELHHSRTLFGSFELRVGGQSMAIGNTRPTVGYLAEGKPRWTDLSQVSKAKCRAESSGDGVVIEYNFADQDEGKWVIEQRFSPGRVEGTIDVQVAFKVNQDRAIIFLPFFTLFTGVGTFGQEKGQGLFAGLEYLENEPSSSEADVVGPASHRQVPDSLKITFPLMAIQNRERYVGLTWQMRPDFSALFDSPDRLFHSNGHVMGLIFPGSNGQNREEGSLLPKQTRLLHAQETVSLHATLLGGNGQSVVAAVQHYVALRGLPALPSGGPDLWTYVEQTASGWLDSKIREGKLIRHAVADNNFGAGPAADAAFWMDWLAARAPGTAEAKRLHEISGDVLGQVSLPSRDFAQVGHIHYPVASLIYGGVAESAAQAEENARRLLTQFEPDGTARYHPQPGGPDYGRTHSSAEASGFSAKLVGDLLQAAAVSGKADLISEALSRLRALDKFRNGVPRGAQTWECPLHTPDILGSGLMVRAYTLGFELSGKREDLEQAQYWAWTGVPFTYLVNPTEKPVGLYSTIAVFGATNWKAPVWLGLPVQWCGLVYAEALYRLVRHDPKGPWQKLANGITLSGIQQSWPMSDPGLQGLLPDSFVLRGQHRNGPAINPATLQACAVYYYGQTPVYDFRYSAKNQLCVHAPGAIAAFQDGDGLVKFQVQPCLSKEYSLLISGLRKQPQIKIEGKPVDCGAPHQWLDQTGRLILRLTGPSTVEIRP